MIKKLLFYLATICSCYAGAGTRVTGGGSSSTTPIFSGGVTNIIYDFHTNFIFITTNIFETNITTGSLTNYDASILTNGSPNLATNSAGSTDGMVLVKAGNHLKLVATVGGSAITNAVSYIASNGSDSNAGSSNSPYATLTAAVNKLNGIGQVYILSGNYTNINIDLSAVTNVTFTGIGVVNMFYGQNLTSLVLQSNGIYAASFDTTKFVYDNTRDMSFWIYEWGNPELGSYIYPTNRHALQRFQDYRLPDFARLTNSIVTSNTATIGNMVNGTWFSTNGTMFVKFSDGSVPGTRTIWLPNSNPTAGFCSNGVSYTSISVANVRSFFGFDGFNLGGASHSSLQDCASMGNYNEGYDNTDMRGSGDLLRCEAGANCNDGFGYTLTPTLTKGSTMSEVDSWCHDNGDEGTSAHFGAEMILLGGLYEYNKASGITPFGGAMVTAYNSTVRYNDVGISLQGDPTDTNASWTNRMCGIWGYRLTLTGNRFGIFEGQGGRATCELYNSYIDSLVFQTFMWTDSTALQRIKLIDCSFGPALIPHTDATVTYPDIRSSFLYNGDIASNWTSQIYFIDHIDFPKTTIPSATSATNVMINLSTNGTYTSVTLTTNINLSFSGNGASTILLNSAGVNHLVLLSTNYAMMDTNGWTQTGTFFTQTLNGKMAVSALGTNANQLNFWISTRTVDWPGL